MARDNPAASRQMRARIAQLAARLMAEDGLDDYGAAKRKAARQIGASETRNLPDNAEVEAALRLHQALYQADEQPERLARLREAAAALMQRLARFDPHLTGSVLAGTAGRYAQVEIHLYTDNAKDVELFLLNGGLDYRTREARFWSGDEPRSVPVFEFESDDTPVVLYVFESRDLRRPVRATAEGRPIERSRLDRLDAAPAAGSAS
jgi:hypothetical protein